MFQGTTFFASDCRPCKYIPTRDGLKFGRILWLNVRFGNMWLRQTFGIICGFAFATFCPRHWLKLKSIFRFISITRYHNIDCGFVNLTISHRPEIGRYRARMSSIHLYTGHPDRLSLSTIPNTNNFSSQSSGILLLQTGCIKILFLVFFPVS